MIMAVPLLLIIHTNYLNKKDIRVNISLQKILLVIVIMCIQNYPEERYYNELIKVYEEVLNESK